MEKTTQTRSERQAKRLELIRQAIKRDQNEQEIIETELDELHTLLYADTDSRQWEALKMAFWTRANVAADPDGFKIGDWEEFEGIDQMVDIAIDAMK